MPEEWIDPARAEVVELVRTERAARIREGSMANCSNCGGTGRHIYVDADGKTKSMTCQACGGSGQR